MEELIKISEFQLELEEHLNDKDYSEDILSYLQYSNGIFKSYYLGYASKFFCNQLNLKKLKFDEGTLTLQEIRSYKEIYKIKKNKDYENSLNRNLIISSWSNFENCINIYLEKTLEPEVIDQLLDSDYRHLKKNFKEDLNETKIEKLKSKLIKDHISSVPIPKKTDILFKKRDETNNNIEKDKNFLLLYGALRNAVHSNFIWNKKDREYEFDDTMFLFKNQEVVTNNSSYLYPFEIYFKMTLELNRIFIKLVK